MTFPDNDQEFSRCWSSKAGQLSALKRSRLLAEESAMRYFVRRQDSVANALRDLAGEIDRLVMDASKELQEFIEEDRRREREKTKMLRH